MLANGAARGPGVFDMKAGVVQILFAIKTLRDLDLDPPAVPLVLLNNDEEIGSRESLTAIDRLSRVASCAFICEPGLGSTGAKKTARKGIAKCVGTIEGGIRANVVAPRSHAVVDVRVLNRYDADHVDAAIRELQPTTPGTSIEVSGGLGRPPMERSARNAALFERARRIGLHLGMDLQEITAGGGSDGNTTSRHTATLDGIGNIGDGAHSPSERIDVGSLAPRTALLAALLMDPVEGGVETEP